MNITRRAFIKGAIGIRSALIVQDRLIQAAGGKSEPWSPAYAVLADKGLLSQRVNQAHAKGLRIPLVCNSSGYERFEMLKYLDGVVDIYLPDMKFMGAEEAELYLAGAGDYPQMAQNALLEMHRQVGLHQVDEHGTAVRGLMIRHLVSLIGKRELIRSVGSRKHHRY